HLSLVCYFSTRTSTTGICTLSLHDALPICGRLVYSFVGMKSKEVVVGSKSIINITLESNIVLQETVTTDALGIRKREARADMAAPMLMGKAAGVQMNQMPLNHHRNYSIIEAENEEYGSFVENQFETPKTAPLSTFSIDVDNASYTNVRRFINNGQKVPKDAVRVEEMVNFFKYQYPEPRGQHPFSINTDYADCPWNAKHKLVRIGLQGKNITTDDLPASNLVFLIDVSGSMFSQNK